MEFEWDPRKAAENLKKHRVSFSEAQEVFSDAGALDDYDPRHSAVEARFRLIGLSNRRLLFVSFTVRGDVVRIISARKATKNEEDLYNDANEKR